MKLNNATRKKVYLEVSKYALDLSKLVFGGVILAGIMDLGVNRSLLLAFGFVFVGLFAAVGFFFFLLGNKKR